MDYSDKYIESIYNKAMIKRTQREKEMMQRSKEEMDKRFWEYLGVRLQKLLEKVADMYQIPGISKQQIDRTEKELGNFFTMVRNNTMPEVIDQLTMDLTREKMSIKIKETN